MAAMNRRPLLMRCGAFGDMVLMTPFIRELATRFGEPVDVISSGAWTRPLLEGQPGVGDIYVLGSRRRPYLISPDQWQLVKTLRRRPIGPTWFLDPGGIGKRLLSRAGINDEWIVDAAAYPRVAQEHQLERWWRIANRMPQALDHPPAPLSGHAIPGAAIETTPKGHALLADWLSTYDLTGKRLLLVQAGNKRTMRRGDRRRASNTKYWPEENWARLIDDMQMRCPSHTILLVGVAQEKTLNDDILRHVKTAHAINAACDHPLERYFALLAYADAMVSVDTGPAHAAAAMGLPEVVLFGQGDPTFMRPWGAPEAPVICLKGDDPQVLSTLSVDKVIAAWRSLPLRHIR
jgi:ADP-heptose:LPS heptosyltransferase